MFESKSWAFLLFLTAIIGIGYTAHYFSSVDAANIALHETKSKLADMHEMLSQRKKSWADMERVSQQTREAMEKNTVLLQAKDILDKRYSAVESALNGVESDLNYAVSSSKAVVEKARSSAPGTELGDITLADGKVLRAAKIRKVEDAGISMIHSDGIGMIALELLPADLKGKFDLGPDGLVVSLDQMQKALTGGGDTETKTPKTQETDTRTVRIAIVALESTLESKYWFKTESENEVRKLKDALKDQFGSVQERTLIELAEAKVGQIQLEITKLELELKKLKIKETGLGSQK